MSESAKKANELAERIELETYYGLNLRLCLLELYDEDSYRFESLYWFFVYCKNEREALSSHQ